MNIPKHIKEHAMLGVATLDSTVSFTVGTGGKFSSVVDALTEASSLADITDTVTTNCTSLESNSSGTLDKRFIKADSGTPFSVFNVGQLVGVKLDGSGCPVLGIIVDDVHILLRHPILTDLSATSCTIGLPSYKSVLIMPGHIEDEITTSPTVPSFTTIEALVRGTTRLGATSGTAVFVVPTSSNETRFKKLGLANAAQTGVQLINYGGLRYQADTYIEEIDGYSAAQDGFYFADGILGGVHVSGCNVTSGYDTFRLRKHREVNLVDNVFDAFSYISSSYAQASAIALGSGSLTAMPVERYNFRGNTLKSYGQDAVTGVVVHGDVRVVDIRNKLNSGAFVNIQGNEIYASGDVDTPGTGEVIGVKCIGSADGETPTITCTDNIFDIRNGGTGDAFSMDSDQANYTIDRAGNVELSGCTTGANTAAATTV